MTVNAFLPPPHDMNQDVDVFNMEFAELDDFLGDMEFQPEFSSSTVGVAQPVSPETMTLTNEMHALELPFPPTLLAQVVPSAVPSAVTVEDPSARVSPASSVCGHSDDESPSNVPTTVITHSDPEIQAAHVKKQKSATTKFAAASKDDAAAAKKHRRRERNREHAKRCRSRKKDYVKSLEDSVVELKQENEQLRRIMMSKFSREELAEFLKDRQTTTSADRFAATLMRKPEAGAPLATATDYLQSLREASV